METIFWLMYLADVLGNIETLIAISIALCAVTILMLTMLVYANGTESLAKYFKPAIIALALLCFAAVFVPSRSTLNLLIAAKAGTLALDTKLGKKTIEAAEAVLDKIITGAKEKK